MTKTDLSKNMTKKLWIFSLEPIETRYTEHWFKYLRDKFQIDLGEDYKVIQIDGNLTRFKSEASSGAFLNFTKTNGWKSGQLLKFLDVLETDLVGDNDVIFFTDFWNPVILQVKYMKDLMDKNWKLISIAHAGSYDPHDFLGRKITDKTWSFAAEKAMAEACDKVIFATGFHAELFRKSIDINPEKILYSGFPMEYTQSIFKVFRENKDRKNRIIFSHRNAPEKQPELFKKLEYDTKIENGEFINCMEYRFSKQEYHQCLSESKVAVSFALQETLGISMYEAMECNVIPVVPNRLSYSEMYDNIFKYDTYDDCVNLVNYFIQNYDEVINSAVYKININKLRTQYFSMDIKSIINK